MSEKNQDRFTVHVINFLKITSEKLTNDYQDVCWQLVYSLMFCFCMYSMYRQLYAPDGQRGVSLGGQG